MDRPVHVMHLLTVEQSLVLIDADLRELLERGARVTTVSGVSTSPVNVPRIEGVEHRTLEHLSRQLSPGEDLAAVRELAALLRELRPDVLHTHTPKAGIYGRIVGRLCRVPVVVNTCRGLPVPERPRRPAALGYLVAEALVGLVSDREFYLSTGDERLVGWPHRGRDVVVGNGIDLRRFGPGEEDRARVRAELGLEPETLVVGAVGRRVAEKGMFEFSAAATALGERAVFLWVGPDDPDKSDALAGDLPGVRFVGNRTDIERLYRAFDVFALPTYREGFSRSGMEAAATGLPVVTTAIRGTAGLGQEGIEVVRVPVGDAAALTAALQQLLDDAELRHRLGQAARERALTNYDARRISATYIQHYDQVARRKRLGWEMGESGPPHV